MNNEIAQSQSKPQTNDLEQYQREMGRLKYAIGLFVIANLLVRLFEPEPTDTLAIGIGYVVSVFIVCALMFAVQSIMKYCKWKKNENVEGQPGTCGKSILVK